MKRNQKFFIAAVIFCGSMLLAQAGMTPKEEMALMFREAVDFGNVTNAMTYLKKAPELVNQKALGDDTPLIAAARNGRYEMVEMLLTNNADVNGRGSGGATALHLAVETGNIKMTELLLNHRADVNAKAVDGYTPIIVATGNAGVIKLLLAHGANINDAFGDNTALSRAIELNSGAAVVQCLLTNGADITLGDLPRKIWTCHDTNAIALLVPYLKNAVPSLLGKMLAEAMHNYQMDMAAAIISASIPFQTNSIHRAVSSGDYDKIHSLLAAHPEAVNETAFPGWTPLHLAAWSGQIVPAQTLLLNRANPDVQDDAGNTPLHWAVFLGNGDLVENILRYKQNMNVKNLSDDTPLVFAIQQGHNSIAAMLITNGAAVGSATPWGETLLHIACMQGNVDAARILLDHGANANALMGRNYKASPLDFAVQGNSPDLVSLLISHGANVQTLMQTQSGAESTTFHLWAGRSMSPSTFPLGASKGNPAIADQLLAAGCDVNAKDGDVESPLHIAVERWYSDVQHISTKSKANGAPTDFVMVTNTVDQAVLWLLTHKADTNAKNKEGQTPLHLAAHHCNLSAMRVLLDHGAEVNVIDNKRKNPLAVLEEIKTHEDLRPFLPRVDFKAAEKLLQAHGASGPILSPPPRSGPINVF